MNLGEIPSSLNAAKNPTYAEEDQLGLIHFSHVPSYNKLMFSQ